MLSRFCNGLVMILIVLCGSAWETRPLVATGQQVTAVLVLIISSAGRFWCLVHQQRRDRSTLMQTGPYSICRHPLYFFRLLGVLGVGLVAGSFLVMGLGVASFALYYPPYMHKEERELKKRYGAVFDQYIARVPLFRPKPALFIPAGIESIPISRAGRLILKAGWFVWLGALIILIRGLQHHGLLPVYGNLF